MLVSIITPTYNSINQILETYESIKKQTYKKWEWLVTDDCSQDGTYELLNDLSKFDERIKVFKNEVNSGAAASRNNSIRHATGHYFAFIDSDDLWSPLKLEKQLSTMKENDAKFSFTAYNIIDANGVSTGKQVDTNQITPLDYENMLRKKATLGCSTVMIDAKHFGNLQMPEIKTTEDYALWLSLLKTGIKVYPINDVLMSYRVLPNSLSRNKIKKSKTQWYVYRQIEKLPLLKAIECFCFYAYRAVFRK
ncbi:glycosyltransferase family 2 protein [Vibrio hyugaensis]|uniref:glycosyltransferase family 2 protein n=1 Tax=Vibrio hyugaensis TaxID=1534743 RepID=UPI003D9FC6BA